MHSSFLSLSVDEARQLEAYALSSSPDICDVLKTHWQWTRDNFPDADRSSSLFQAQWMMQRAQERKATRVLDIGCYTGLSAIAMHQGTHETRADIITIEYDAKLASLARETFAKHGFDDRIHVAEGRAEDILDKLQEPFDLIFVDLEFSAYRLIVGKILENKLLQEGGVILVDNVFARGFVLGKEIPANVEVDKLDHWNAAGRLVRDFNEFLSNDSRVRVTLLPFFDGIAEVRMA
ncbi:S-adenosyl-L-methionine-dependent methyltransferase [Xylaria sp. FL1042]|nr:S-adenosyl-L-methionine-dependent methyltransferase [Xylaria sp. FL1042]